MVDPLEERRPYDRLIADLEEAARSAPPDLVDDVRATLTYFVGFTDELERQDAWISRDERGVYGFEAQVRRQSLAPPGKQRLAVDEDILTEVTGRKRNRVYLSPRIMDAVYGLPDDATSDIEG